MLFTSKQLRNHRQNLADHFSLLQCRLSRLQMCPEAMATYTLNPDGVQVSRAVFFPEVKKTRWCALNPVPLGHKV